MKYLLIGGCGFIGQALTKSLLLDNHDVVVIDNLSTSPPQKPHMRYVRIVAESAQQCAELNTLVQWADVVYFLAGSVGVARVTSEPFDTMVNNLELATAVIGACQMHNKYVVFFSTSEVYHDGPYTESDEAHMPTNSPRWGYASAKLTTEFLIRSADIPYKIVRLFNVTGPGQLGTHGMVLPRFIQAAKNNQPLFVNGSGEQIRSFMHVEDACSMIRSIEQIPTSDTFNIGSPLVENTISIINLAKLVVNMTHSASDIVCCDSTALYGVDCQDINNRRPNMTKTMNAIQHISIYTLRNIIDDMVNYD